MIQVEAFDIRNFAENCLTPRKGKNRYHCPVCDGNLSIDFKSGKYNCWTSDCDKRDIREAIRPWAEVQQQLGNADYVPAPRKAKPKPPTPAPIPAGDIELGKLPNPVKTASRVARGANFEIIYPYSTTQWVLRIEFPNGDKLPIPYHIDSRGEAVRGKGDQPWQPYRMPEILQHGAGQWVLGVEGEKCADTSRSFLQLLSFTFQGGSWTEALLLDAMLAFKAVGVRGVVYWPDHDEAGYTKAGKCAVAAAKVGLPFITINPTRLWPACPTGGDVSDWVKAGQSSLDALQNEINLVAIERAKTQSQQALETVPPPDDLYIKEQTGVEQPELLSAMPSDHSSDWRQDYENKRKERAKFKFTRKPDIAVQSGYLPTIKLETVTSWLLGIKGDWGTGKSFLVKSLLKTWTSKVIQVAHLNALLANTAPKFDCFHHRELKDLSLGLTSADRIAITDVSLAAQFDPGNWSKGEQFILVLDELEQVLKSVQTNTNLKGTLRVKARVKLEWLIRNATYVIASDRDLCDETLEYLEGVRGEDKKAFIVHHQGKKGITRKPIKINHNKQKDEIVSEIIRDAKQGKKIAIPCENKSDLLALELELQKAGISDKAMFFAHGDNSNEPEIKQLIEQIDKVYTEYQIVGYTMTMGTAISLELPHFDKIHGLFSGDVLSAGDQAQMLFRYRIDCDITVWVNPRLRTLEIDPEKSLSNLVRNLEGTNKLIASIDQIGELIDQGILPTARGEISDDDLPWINHKLGIKARANASRANPFQSLYDLLQEDGFNIILECNDTDESLITSEGQSHKEQKKEIKQINDKTVSTSELMTDIEYQSALMNPGNLTKKERDRLAKTKLHKDTGLEITQQIVKLERTKGLVRGARMLNVLLGDDATAAAYDLIDRERYPDVGDQYFYSEIRKLLYDLGIPEFIDKLKQPGWEYTSDTLEAQEIASKARLRHKDVKRILGKTISLKKNKDGSFKVGTCAIIGAILSSLCIKKQSTRVRGRGWVYRLDTEHWEMLASIINHVNSQSHTPTINLVIDRAKTQAQQALELVPPPNDLYIKEQTGVEQPELLSARLSEHSDAINPELQETIATQPTAQRWKGLKLQVRKGLKFTEEIFANAYQRCVNEFVFPGIVKSEPYLGSVEGLHSVDINFGERIGIWGIPCEWLEFC